MTRDAALGPRAGAAALPAALVAVCGTLAVLAAQDGRWNRRFDYLRSDVAAGEAWRLVTGHLMHWSASHAALDVVALALVAWIFVDALSLRAQGMVCAASIAAIDAALWWLHPDVERYVGLSGLLHGWFAAGAVCWCVAPSRARAGDALRMRAWGAALLVGLGVKLAIEAEGGAFWLHDAAFPVVTAAHRWGAGGGAAGAIVVVLVRRLRSRAGAVGGSRGR